MKVEKGFPIPSTTKTKYPWAEMEKGDSFLLETDNLNLRVSLAAAGKNWASKHKKEAKFLTRKVDNGFRTWRIE